MAHIAIQFFVAYALSRLAASLSKGEKETPLVDEKPSSSSTRGAFVPILQGTRRLGSHIGWVGHRVIVNEAGGSGGKGGGTDTGSTQRVYYEDAFHVLCIGPAKRLFSIIANGETLEIGGTIDSDGSPSGSQFTATGEEFTGTFRIYWGERQQPVNFSLADSDKVGISSSWPFICYIEWIDCRLGGFASWPALEYEIEVGPYNTTTILSPTPIWVENALGEIDNVLDQIGEILNSTSAPYIKIPDDGTQAAKYTDGGFANITGQPGELNRIYKVLSAVYDSGGVILDPDGGSTFFFPVEDDLTDAVEWVQDSNIVSVTRTDNPPQGMPSLAPPGSFAYELLSATSGGGGVILHSVASPNDTMNDGKNTFVVRIYDRVAYNGPGGASVGSFELGFEAINGPSSPADNHTHKVIIKFSGFGTVDIEQINGCYATVSSPDSQSWRTITVTYNGGTGENPSTSAWDRQIRIRGQSLGFPFGEPFSLWIYHDTPDWAFENAGTIITGVTTISMDEPMVDILQWVGEVQAWKEGEGDYRGTNPIHTLIQLMFSPHPHGAGMDVSKFSSASLNAAALFFAAASDGGTDGYRCNLLAQNGEEYRAVIGNIMMDLGMMWSWDAEIGKYTLEIIREPLSTPPNVPEGAQLSPKAEIDSIQEAMMFDRIIFGFPDRALKYRDNGVPSSDHGLSSQRGRSHRTDVVALYTINDLDMAKKVAPRRSQEEFAPPTNFKHNLNREARRLRPGMAITLDNFDPVQRIMKMTWDTNSPKLIVDCFADTYGVQADEFLPLTTSGGDTSAIPPVDFQSLAYELPAVVTLDMHLSIIVPRIRQDANSSGANYYLSNDDLTYRFIGRRDSISAGGTLAEEVLSNSRLVIETGYLVNTLGPDMLRIAKSLTDIDWRAGKQWALVGAVNRWEIWYVREVTIISSTQVRFDGIIRSPLGIADTNALVSFDQQATPVGQTLSTEFFTNEIADAGIPSHAIGDEIYLFQIDEVPTFRDLALQPNDNVYIKVQPVGDKTATLASILPSYLELQGKTYKPVQISRLRLIDMTRSYPTGANVAATWNFTENFAKQRRIGGGFFTSKETSVGKITLDDGTFSVVIYDKLDVVVHTESPTDVAAFSYSNADIISDLGGEEDFIIGVTYTNRGYSSAEIRLYITKV